MMHRMRGPIDRVNESIHSSRELLLVWAIFSINARLRDSKG